MGKSEAMGRILLCVIVACSAATGADILSAASAGKTADVKNLLDQGANIEARDKNDRTPLMLAAQHGQSDTVALLLSRGAHAEARDKFGYTAYGLTLFAPAGHGDHEAALKALPATPKIRLSVSSDLNPARLQSSCYLGKMELPSAVTPLRLDGILREEFVAFANTSGKGLVAITPDPADPSDAILSLTVIPGVECEPSGGDNLTLSIDARLFRASDKELLYEKTFGGGFKGLRAQIVHNVAQYGPVFLNWVHPQAGPIYWAAAERLYRSKL